MLTRTGWVVRYSCSYDEDPDRSGHSIYTISFPHTGHHPWRHLPSHYRRYHNMVQLCDRYLQLNHREIYDIGDAGGILFGRIGREFLGFSFALCK